MRGLGVGLARRGMLATVALFGTMAMAGCDEHVEIIRDSTIPVMKHMTWAWRPARQARNEGRNNRPVISRDVMASGNPVVGEGDPATEMTRREVRAEIERQLNQKGLTQISDPEAADFLADYHFAVRGHKVTVREVYPTAYPGLVCGPFGCSSGWGYGPAEVAYHNVRFREGTFVFDLLQSATNRLAYQAIGQEPVHKAQFSQDQIQDMVHALLKGLKLKG